MSELDILKLLQAFGEETELGDFSPEELKEMLYQKAKEIHVERFPYNDFLFQKYDEDVTP